ncbi:MAG: transcription antitermination factor NusB [Nitrospirota bacterium]|nr:transcription antitermination factor NusB [Nitrospirota bacterium]MDH5587497.1 transcription antitermination factor NusB [Nitrospirota bacterium]
MAIPADVPPAPPIKSGSSRRLARQLALQLLFQQEFQAKQAEWQANFWEEHPTTSVSVKTFATDLLQGVKEHQADIDGLIQKFAVGWSIARMPVVDRNILRCAIYEFLWEPDIPAAVTINEAIELAKRFADDEAQRFVNGILDHVLRDEERLALKRSQLNPKEPTQNLPPHTDANL